MNEIQLIEKEIPADVITQASAAFQQGLTLLKPYLQAITSDDSKKLFKMSDGSEPFVSKTQDFIATDAEFAPRFLNVDNLKTGLAVYQQLLPLCSLFTELGTMACDTRMIAGAQAFKEALKYYDSVQTASKNRVPGAKPIADELKKRFARKSKKKDAVEATMKKIA